MEEEAAVDDLRNKHVAKMVHSKLESNGAIACLMRCCDDPTTDSWHTLYVQPETSSQEIQDFIRAAQTRTEQQHAAIANAHAIMEGGLR